MTDNLFDEAKILYELLTKTQQPINDDLINQLSPLLGLTHGTEDLLARLHRIMKGFPAEDEFIAISLWMEQCKLIHKLDQDQFPPASREQFQVPDLFAVFDINGAEVPVLIEVKSTNSPKKIYKFRLGEKQYTKLTNYSKKCNLPLLIARKILGHWVLFDIREMQKRETAYHINLEDTMKADLMYTLVGNLNITPMPGNSFSLIFEDLGPTGRKSSNGEEHNLVARGIRVSGENGTEIDKMSTAEFLLFMLSDHEEKQYRKGNTIEIAYKVINEPTMIPSYGILAFMLFGMRSGNHGPSTWYEIIKSNDFGSMSYTKFRDAMTGSIGNYVRYIMQVVPHHKPDFLPAPVGS